MKNKTSSLISHFRKNSISAISITALLIAISITLIEYQHFLSTSEKIEEEHIAEQKKIIKDEVIRFKNYISNTREQTIPKLKTRIKQRVDDAHTIASSIYAQHHGKWPEHKIKESIKSALRNLRFFNGDGYYFVLSDQGIMQVHGLNPEFEGKNRLKPIDSPSYKIVSEFKQIISKKGEGFHNYNYNSFSQKDKQRKKITFVKHFKPYDWIIGTGDYEKNIEEALKKDIINYALKLRFHNDLYIFILNYDGDALATSPKSIIGKNLSNMTDLDGVNIFEQQLNVIKENEGGFISYSWKKPTNSIPATKTSYITRFEDWQWILGAGVFMDDFQNTIDVLKSSLRSSLITKLVTLFLLTAISVGIIIFRTNITAKRIRLEQDQFSSFFKAISTDSKQIDLNKLNFTEFRSLAKSANHMLIKQSQIEADKADIELRLRQSQKMEALGKIVGGIAHDFNNLLGIIMGYSELLTSTLNKKEKQHSYASHILDASKRGSKLTNKLLNISSIKEQSASNLDINQFLLTNKELFQKTITAGIKLELRLSPNINLIYVDESDLSDTLINLCINAMHAMENASNPLLILSSSEKILTNDEAISLELSEGEYIELSIIDNGIGIESEILEHIFEPFFTTKGEFGTGLGLSQVYAFMKRCHGTITIDSTLKQGSCFSLLFPQAAKEIQSDILNSTPNKNTTILEGNETILIVDDEVSITVLAAEILETHGYKTVQANSGKHALEILNTQTVDLLLSDVIMPEMSGDKLAAIVREQYKDLPIQLCSGYSEQHSAESAVADLYGDLLQKPFQAIELLQCVRSLLNQKAALYP